MTTPFAAGQKLRASELDDRLAVFGRVLADVSVTNSTTLVNAAGLAVAMQANSIYAMDGYIAYTCNGTADVKFAISVPTGTVGSWGLYAVAVGSTGGEGDISAARLDAFGDSSLVTAGGNSVGTGAMSCLPRGLITTAATAGSLQVRFAQNTANATPTKIEAGSWLRLVRIGELF